MKNTLEKIIENKSTMLKQLIPFIIIIAFALFATQSWKGEAGFPATQYYDFPLHAYKMWYVADHIQHGNFFFDFDYKSNALFARSYPILPYLVGAPFVMVGGLWNGISWFVIFCYLLIGIGAYLLARELQITREFSIVASVTTLLSYSLVLETAHAGALHRLFAYALLPFIIYCTVKPGKFYKVAFVILLASAILTHPTTAIYFAIAAGVFTIANSWSNNSRNSLKKLLVFALLLIMAGLISLFYLGPTIIEQGNGALNKPLYLEGTGQMFGNGVEEISALVQRNFGFSKEGKVTGYLGITIIALAAIGAVIGKNQYKVPLLCSALFFLAVLFGGDHIPSIIQAVHYSRPLFMASVFLAVLAGIGVQEIAERIGVTRLSQHKKTAIATAIIILLVIDLSPGLSAFQNGPFTKEITYLNSNPQNESEITKVNTTLKEVIDNANPNGRVLLTQYYFGHAWSTQTQHNFIQHSQESVNPEYHLFTYYLYQHRENSETIGRLGLLGVAIYLAGNQNEAEYSGLIFPSTPAFKPTKTILIYSKNPLEGQKIMEWIVAQPYFDFKKVGLILNTENIHQIETDYKLVQKKTTPREIDLDDLEKIFNSTPEGENIPVENRNNKLTLNTNQTGLIFISQMYYPHFKYDGAQVMEAAGGLIAISKTTPEPATIYWEKPWYDYLFGAISALSLLAIIVLSKTNEKHHLLD